MTKRKVKKGGRPKKAGDRYPSGKLRPQTDLGTPEMRRNRALMINPDLANIAPLIDGDDAEGHDKMLAFIVAQKEADDRRASYPLGILAARHLVTSRQHYAGRKYMQLYTAALQYGGANVKSCLANVVSDGGSGRGGGYEPAGGVSDETHQREYLSARSALRAAGYASMEAVVWVAVFQNFPMAEQLVALKIGLDALSRHFEPVSVAPIPEQDRGIDLDARLAEAEAAAERVAADPEKLQWLEDERAKRLIRQA